MYMVLGLVVSVELKFNRIISVLPPPIVGFDVKPVYQERRVVDAPTNVIPALFEIKTLNIPIAEEVVELLFNFLR